MLTSPKSNKNRALTDPRTSAASAHKHEAGCLWSGKLWSTLFVDEAHYARTPSALFHGLNALASVSSVKILATATPLVNEPKVGFIKFA
jgi:hypothetical protein